MTEQTVPPFELKVGGPNGIDNADVPVRWCITPELVQEMNDTGIIDPHILLVTVDPTAHSVKRAEMSRHLIPVGDLMTYIRFTRAGVMKIYGWIVDGADGRKQLHHDYMHKTKGDWNTTLVSGHKFVPAEIERAYQGTIRTVSIPTTVFGKEPPHWLKWYANLGFSSGPRDQCDFRKRVLFGIPKFPFFLIIAAVLTFVKVFFASIFTLAGFRHSVQWRYAWRPFEHPFSMAFNTDDYKPRKNPHKDPQRGVGIDDLDWWLGNRFIWWRKDRKNRNVMGVSFLPFIPLWVLLIVGINWLVKGIFVDAVIATAFFTYCSVLIFIAIDLVINLVVFIDNYGGEMLDWILNSAIGGPVAAVGRGWRSLDNHLAQTDRWPTVILAVLIMNIALIMWIISLTWVVSKFVLPALIMLGVLTYLYVRIFDWIYSRAVDLNDPMDMRELLCAKDPMNMVASYRSIPLSRRSLSLSFKFLKNYVCKPMQD